jgi:hypothetical protein
MSTPSLVKQPSESRLYQMDFSGNMTSGEAITAVVSFTADTPEGADALVISEITGSGQVASARIAGGEAGFKYKVTVRVTTDGGNTLEAEGILQLKDL